MAWRGRPLEPALERIAVFACLQGHDDVLREITAMGDLGSIPPSANTALFLQTCRSIFSRADVTLFPVASVLLCSLHSLLPKGEDEAELHQLFIALLVAVKKQCVRALDLSSFPDAMAGINALFGTDSSLNESFGAPLCAALSVARKEVMQKYLQLVKKPGRGARHLLEQDHVERVQQLAGQYFPLAVQALQRASLSPLS